MSFPGCCWMSSKRYFLANNINPFIGLLGLSQSFSFFNLAGEGGGGDPLAMEGWVGRWGAGGPNTNADPWPPGARGEDKSSPVAGRGEAADENSKRLTRSQRSGVRMASGWLGGKQISPTDRSWHRTPYWLVVEFGLREHQPERLEKMSYYQVFFGFRKECRIFRCYMQIL